MPYHIEKSGNGYRVMSPNGPMSRNPLTRQQAEAQMRAIYANSKEHESKNNKHSKNVYIDADGNAMEKR